MLFNGLHDALTLHRAREKIFKTISFFFQLMKGILFKFFILMA